MPKPIKIALSLLFLFLAFVAWLLRDSIGLGVSPYFLFPFAVFVVCALWVFPEPARKKLPGA